MHSPGLDFWSIVGVAYIATSLTATAGSIIIMLFQVRRWIDKKGEERLKKSKVATDEIKTRLDSIQQDINDLKKINKSE